MFVYKAIKYRIYPTKQQAELFIKTFGCCRKLWNLMLEDKIQAYKDTGSFVINKTYATYKKDYSYFNEVDSQALSYVQLHIWQAFKNTFESGFGFPQFKSIKHSKKSYTTVNLAKIRNGVERKWSIRLFKDCIKLPKAGKVKAKIHHLPGPTCRLKSATISQDADDKFYVSVLFEYNTEIIQISKLSENAIGLDYTTDGLYVDSNNNTANMPKYYQQSQKRLAKQQRKLSRKQCSKKGEEKSKNYLKQKKRLAKLHKHVANQRKDFLHKLSTEIANQYDVVCVENLNMIEIAKKNKRLAKAVMDSGNSIFIGFLQYKLFERGKYLVKVDRYYASSQICSNCGSKQKLKLSERTYNCPNCGLVINRDYNAALNILHEGLRILRAS